MKAESDINSTLISALFDKLENLEERLKKIEKKEMYFNIINIPNKLESQKILSNIRKEQVKNKRNDSPAISLPNNLIKFESFEKFYPEILGMPFINKGENNVI